MTQTRSSTSTAAAPFRYPGNVSGPRKAALQLLYHRISSDTTTTPPQNNSTSDVAAAAFAYVHAGRARSGHRFHAAPVLLRVRRLPPRIRLSRVVRNVGTAPSYS